jgi:HEPN domain-containing protein
MKPATTEWVAKAEGDFTTAGRELRARKSPNYDAVCFHAQQCAEKYLKAVLQQNERNVPKIHNLIELMLLCEEIDHSFEMLRADLVMIERYSVRTRYPGETAEKGDARSA